MSRTEDQRMGKAKMGRANRKRGAEEYQRCPKCGKTNPGYRSFCEKCNYQLKEKVLCSRCHAMGIPNAHMVKIREEYICPRCSGKTGILYLRDEYARFLIQETCPSCGGSNLDFVSDSFVHSSQFDCDKLCRDCGHRFH